jgi:hypothetical protein
VNELIEEDFTSRAYDNVKAACQMVQTIIDLSKDQTQASMLDTVLKHMKEFFIVRNNPEKLEQLLASKAEPEEGGPNKRLKTSETESVTKFTPLVTRPLIKNLECTELLPSGIFKGVTQRVKPIPGLSIPLKLDLSRTPPGGSVVSPLIPMKTPIESIKSEFAEKLKDPAVR